MAQVNIQLPKSLLDFTPEERAHVLETLRNALQVPETVTLARNMTDEHNIWERNHDHLVADAEDELYTLLVTESAKMMARVMDELGLPIESEADTLKAFSPAFQAWEDTLIKGKGKKGGRISDLVNENRKKRQKIVEWVQEKKAMTKAQLARIDKALKENLPKYADIAEGFMTRGAFLGKIRNVAEGKNYRTISAFIEHTPTNISAARKEQVVLTLREPDKGGPKRIDIMPLTALEADAATHASHSAADKLTEVSDRHQAQIRQMVILANKERWGSKKLAEKLYDKFGEHNRDWRRVAITELSFAVNDAYVAGCEEGERVVGMGASNACKHCQTYVIGKEFTITHIVPDADTYESDMKHIWVGKTNFGRRVQEYRACIPLHPNCRCRWHRVSKFYAVAQDGSLKRKTTAELIQEERKKRGLPPDPHVEETVARIQKHLNQA